MSGCGSPDPLLYRLVRAEFHVTFLLLPAERRRELAGVSGLIDERQSLGKEKKRCKVEARTN